MTPYAASHVKYLEFCSHLKLLNQVCKGGWSPAALLQQVHTAVVVADVGGENQELWLSGQEDVCDPLALLPEEGGRKEKRGEEGGATSPQGYTLMLSELWGMSSGSNPSSLIACVQQVLLGQHLTSGGGDSRAHWGFCGAACKHQAARWESPEAALHSARVPPRLRPLHPQLPESPEGRLVSIIYCQKPC